MNKSSREKISSRQYMIIVCLYSIGTTILITPGGLAGEAKQDAWLAAIVGVLAGLLLIGLYAHIGNNLSNLSFVAYMEKLLGGWIGKVVSISFILFCFIGAATLLWIVGNFMVTEVLVETPVEIVLIMFLFIVLFGVKLGLETMARSAEIFFPWVMVLFLILVIFITPEMNIDNLFPILENGVRPILRASLLYLSVSPLTLVVLLAIYPHIAENKTLGKRSYIIGYTTSGVIIFLVVILSILVLGVDFTSRSTAPTYILGKKVSIGDFLERIEIIIAIIWIISIYYKLVLYLYVAIYSFSEVLNLSNYRPLVFPAGLILVVLSLIVYPNTVFANEWDSTTWVGYAVSIGLFLPLLLLVIAKIKKIS